ncbi:MAG: dicarboxylate/amino acid:cation symporter [Verrucomicrobia bacterium]|nr:MAG: dicarboxylate/amino acid:cation symporter [Verrucomicrobiota bacterium]PYJ33474.1 MAG: dicarboxylate/amino acid:cation symporter [Verrucomicrobiota bacterium]
MTMVMTAKVSQRTRRPWYRPSLTVQIMIGLVVGGVIGWLRPDWGNAVYFLRDIFINLIKSIIAPLVFSTIVVGIAGAGALRKVGRMGIKALIYFEIVTTAALFIGLAVVNFTKPGAGVTLAATSTDVIKTIEQSHPKTLVETIVHAFPSSVIEAMVRGDVLQIVMFSVLFALAVSAIGEKGKPIIRAMESLSQIMFKFTNYVMLFAPIGVGAAMAHTIGTQGPGVLVNLAKLIGSLYLALVIFILSIFGLVIWIARIPLRQFVRAVREPAALAFATTSSESALPKAMESMERFGVPRHIVGFVMPTGYSFNLDGSTLYLALASVFVAQAAETTTGWHMGFGQQIVMMLTLMFTSKGVAAVPRASLVILLATLNSFLPSGLGPIGVAIIFGVDELMDMGRTCVNVIGNCLATVVVARWEKEFDERRAHMFGTPAEAELDLKSGDVAFADAVAQGD